MKITIFFVVTLLQVVSSIASAQTDFYPNRDIEKFLKLSATDMIDFVHSREIEIYKFETTGKPDIDKTAEQFLAAVPMVDKSAYVKFKDLFDGDTLGVFFSRHNAYYNVKVDTMLLSHEADLWTIAHELSHALIDKNRHFETMLQQEELSFNQLANAKEDYEESMSGYRMYGKFLSNDHALRAFESIKVWTTILTDMLYTFELEEVKIERALINIYETQKKSGLDKKSYDRSFFYAKRNCQKALDKIDLVKDVVEYYDSIISSETKSEIQEDLQTHIAFINNHHNYIHEYCK